MSLLSFSFNGRISRKTFIFRIIVCAVLAVLFAFVLDYLNILEVNVIYDTFMANYSVMETVEVFRNINLSSTPEMSQTIKLAIVGVMALVLVLHFLSSVVRRLHDMNKTGWWALLLLLCGLCIWPNPLNLSFDMWPTISLVLSFVPLVLLLVLIFVKGNNDYAE